MQHKQIRVWDRESVRQWSAELPEEFIMCRDMGHLWRPFRAHYVAEGGGYYHRVIRCGRCQTERSQDLSTTGEILSGHYAYPDDYCAPAGAGRIDSTGRATMRLESTLRLIGKDGGK